MKIYKTFQGFVVEHENQFYISRHTNWDLFINREDLFYELQREIQLLSAASEYKSLIDNGLQAPIQSQEIWTAGGTYLSRRTTGVKDAISLAEDSLHGHNRDAERPELFFKTTAHRVVGSGQNVRIRRDSKWNIAEPELTLFINSRGQISGYTAGNDISSRDISGENLLYLPQAKTYDKSAAIGPCITVFDEVILPETKISIEILRFEIPFFSNSITINQIQQRHTDLVEFLYRESSFPHGCFLMIGTGLVPNDGFTLEVGDEIRISIEGIGTLVNFVEMK